MSRRRPFFLLCNNSVVSKRVSSKDQMSTPSTAQTSLNSFSHLWGNDELTDVMILVGEEPEQWLIPAHKIVLARYSPVFQKMLYGSLKESTGSEIIINDVRPEIFDQMLKFLYTAKLRIDGIEEAIQLHQTAHKYMITHVVSICIQYLCSNINRRNVLDIYSCLELYMDEAETLPLQLACATLIDEWSDEVFTKNAFLILKPDSVFDLTARSTINLSSELILFHAVNEWSIVECKRRHLPITNENKRSVLGKTLFNVRFGLLDEGEIQQGPMKSGLLKPEDRKLFSNTPRLKESFSTCRLRGTKSYDSVGSENQENSLSFFFDRNVILTSVLLVANESSFIDNKSFFRIIRNEEILLEVDINERNTKKITDNTVSLVLAQPIYIEPQKQYVLYAWLTKGPRIIISEKVTPISTWFDGTKDCKVVWEEHRLTSGGSNSTTLNTGQMFELYFTLPLREESVVSRLQKLAMKAKFI